MHETEKLDSFAIDFAFKDSSVIWFIALSFSVFRADGARRINLSDPMIVGIGYRAVSRVVRDDMSCG